MNLPDLERELAALGHRGRTLLAVNALRRGGTIEDAFRILEPELARALLTLRLLEQHATAAIEAAR